MKTYPSLYAALTPDTVNGRRGSTVRCTASLRDIGFIWWSADGSTVTWHWRTGEYFGERTTERNAVQALRDVANAMSGRTLPRGPDDTDTTTRATTSRATTRRAPADAVAPAPAPKALAPQAPARRVVWGDEAHQPDLAAAIAAAFRQGNKS
jgi:hypothetical protein